MNISIYIYLNNINESPVSVEEMLQNFSSRAAFLLYLHSCLKSNILTKTCFSLDVKLTDFHIVISVYLGLLMNPVIGDNARYMQWLLTFEQVTQINDRLQISVGMKLSIRSLRCCQNVINPWLFFSVLLVLICETSSYGFVLKSLVKTQRNKIKFIAKSIW